MRWIDWFGVNDGVCPIQSASGRMVGVDSLGLLRREGKAGSSTKFFLGLVCRSDPLSDYFQLADICYDDGLVRAVSVYGDLSRALVCPMGSVCRC